jgi:hypothetical protein
MLVMINLLAYSWLKKFLIGFLIKFDYIYLYGFVVDLHFLVSALVFNTLLKCDSLLDCFAVDYPMNFHRFAVIYSFWNYNLGQRIFLKIFIKLNQWILSITSFFSSPLDLKEKFEIYMV